MAFISPLSPEVVKELIGGATVAAQVANLTTTAAALDPRFFAVQLIRGALFFTSLIFIIRMLYAGFLWFTSEGNTETTGKAKKIIVQSSIGAGVMLLSFTIAQLVSFRVMAATQRNILDARTTCTSTAAVCCKEFAAYQNFSVSGGSRMSNEWGGLVQGIGCTVVGTVTLGNVSPGKCSNRKDGQKLLNEWKRCRESKGSWF